MANGYGRNLQRNKQILRLRAEKMRPADIARHLKVNIGVVAGVIYRAERICVLPKA